MFVHSTLAVILSLITSVFVQGSAQNVTYTAGDFEKLRYCYELCKPCDESKIYNNLPIVQWSKAFDGLVGYNRASELPIYFDMDGINKHVAASGVNDFVSSAAKNTMLDLMSKRAGADMLEEYCHTYEEWARQQRTKLGCETCEQSNKKLIESRECRKLGSTSPISMILITK